jgi:parallel beta-helix repeat protein
MTVYSLRRLCTLGAVLVVALTSLFVFSAALTPASAAPAPTSGGDCGLGGLGATYHGTSASRNLQRAIPDPLKVVSYPCPFPKALRGIDVRQSQLRLVAGGQLVRSIDFPHAGQTVTLPQIVAAIHDPSWISMDGSGVVTLNAALVQEPGTKLRVTEPVTSVRIVNRQNASIAGSHAVATFSGVTVTSWDAAADRPVLRPKIGRPFVLYEKASRFDIDHSTFRYLGSDVSSSYGVSWRQGGSTGTVTQSLFEHNFFGVYSYRAANILFEHNTFRRNVYYGMDPHTYSSHLTIRDNNVYGNGDHGIVFSRFVTDSLVADNHVHDNKVNGIMMDYHSNSNEIRDNVVRHNSQGIVMSGSGDDYVHDNQVADNEIGIRASHDGAVGERIRHNTISGGHIGIKLYGGAARVTLQDNSITGATATGIVVDAPQTAVTGNRVVGAETGITVQTVATVSGGQVSGAGTGIKIDEQGIASVSGVAVAAQQPIRVAKDGYVKLSATSFSLPQHDGGKGHALSTLSIIGVAFLAFAVLCEIVHALRGWQLRRLELAWVGAGVAAYAPRPAYVPRAAVLPSPQGSRLLVRRPRPPEHTHHQPRNEEFAPAPRDTGLRKFRPDVEGLRAIAVISVVLSHASLGLGGGYIGVDVFFVISGFLITRQLVEERQGRGRISFSGFYARRARRILPAATLVTVVTLVAAWHWASPLRVGSIARDGLAAALFGVNWRLASQGTNYFNQSAPQSPFQHYWSLSVEEQFYLFWPILLVTISLLFARKFGVIKPLLVTLAAVVAVSLWQSITVTSGNAPYAYFGTHTRAWELAIGALIAVGAPALVRLPTAVCRLLAWAGLAAIVMSCFVYGSNTPFPGVAALLPVLGAGAVIAGGCGAQRRMTAESVLLQRRPMQFFGKISYSLYLWHWPLLILAPEILGRDLTVRDRLATIALAVALSTLTYVFLEEPIRHQRALVRKPRRAGGLAAGLIATSVIAALLISALVSLPGSNQPTTNPVAAAALEQLSGRTGAHNDRQLQSELAAAAALQTLPANVTPPLAKAPTDAPDTKDCEVGLTVSSPKLPCNQFGDVHSKTQIVLTGDSHAGMWLDALNAIALQHHWRLTVLSKSGCSVGDYPDLTNPQLKRVFTECNQWRPRMIAQVRRIHPAMVIIGSEARDIAGTEPNGLVSSIDKLKVGGTKVAFLADTPLPRDIGDVPDCLAQHTDNVTACDIPRDQAGLDSTGRTAEIQAAQEAGANIIDPSAWMCTQQVCPAVIKNEIVYQDDSHITTTFAQLREPELGAALTQVMAK